MTVQVWIGTPNEMGKAAEKPTQPAAVKWARDYLSGMKLQARKYDSAAPEDIQRVHDELGQVTTLVQGGVRSWSFPYMGITLRIELRRPT